jgi:hypothetical protein
LGVDEVIVNHCDVVSLKMIKQIPCKKQSKLGTTNRLPMLPQALGRKNNSPKTGPPMSETENFKVLISSF